MTQTKMESLADEFTNKVMSAHYGERFINCDDLNEDNALSQAWDELNDQFYELLLGWVNE